MSCESGCAEAPGHGSGCVAVGPCSGEAQKPPYRMGFIHSGRDGVTAVTR